MATSCRPEIAVVAVGGRALDGLDLTERLSEAAPETAVIVISIHSDERYVQRALEVGAHAYVTKDEIADFLIPEIRAAHEAMMCRSRHSEA
jgi:DNA-binding NarL/FixJ family response regulator